MATQFGDLVKGLRIGLKKTLRTFCSDMGFDPSNWSKVERGINAAPKEEVLKRVAEYFKLKEEALVGFMDFAAVSRGEIPTDILTDEAVMKKMPLFFRNVRNEQTMTGDQVGEMMKGIRELNIPDPDEG